MLSPGDCSSTDSSTTDSSTGPTGVGSEAEVQSSTSPGSFGLRREPTCRDLAILLSSAEPRCEHGGRQPDASTPSSRLPASEQPLPFSAVQIQAADGNHPIHPSIQEHSQRHWVIGDVHGCAESLWDLVRQLPIHDRLVLCGDVINRGPRIEAAMELAWDLVQSGRAVWLMGNHEQRLVADLRCRDQRSQVALAGCDTYRQLGARSCRRWLERLEQLPLAYWSRGWVATHAGFDPHTWQPDLTVRSTFWNGYDGRFGEVVVGHTPDHAVRHTNNRITLIDTGACYGGTLTAYCPETGQQRSVPGLSQKLLSPRQRGPLAAPIGH